MVKGWLACLTAFWMACLGERAPASGDAPGQRHAPDRAAPGWYVDFERELDPFQDNPPLISPDAATIVVEDLRFDASGRFLSRLPRTDALLRVVIDDRAHGLATLDRGNEHAWVRVELDSMAQDPAVPARGPVGPVAFSTTDHVLVAVEGPWLVRRRLPHLDAISAISIAGLQIDDNADIAVLAGGNVGLRAGSSVVVVDGRGKVRDIARAEVSAFSPEGDAVLIASASGAAEVRSLPDGALVGSLAAGPELDAAAVSVAGEGKRVAILSCSELRIYEARGQGYEQVLSWPREHPPEPCSPSVRFAAQGSALIAGNAQLTVLRRGQQAHERAPLPRYKPVPPSGFRASTERYWPWDQHPGTGWGRTPRRIRGYVRDDDALGLVTVRVDVHDARQIAAADPMRWADALMGRFEPEASEIAPPAIDPIPNDRVRYQRVWQDAQGRWHLDYALFEQRGCERTRRYVRFVQTGHDLLHITVETLPTLPFDRVQPWLDAFLDAPFATRPPSPRSLAPDAPAARSRCDDR